VTVRRLQVRYPASLPTLPMGVSGTHFVTIAGTHQSSLEALLLKRGLRGPGWCLLTGATRKDSSAQVRHTAHALGKCFLQPASAKEQATSVGMDESSALQYSTDPLCCCHVVTPCKHTDLGR
jgi:hypothetical protein